MINRKNTILLAVLINAGLLLVLFVTALTSKDETPAAPTTEPVLAEAPVPLFGDELMSKSQDLVAMAPVSAAAPVMHALPPVAPEPIPVPVMAPPAMVVPEVPVAAAPRVQEVIVRKGETLDKIAKAHRTTVDEIIKLNHLSSSFLRVGQIVKVPGEKGEKSSASKAVSAADKGSDYYIVKVGDNPWTIAMKHHMKVEELLRLNGMNEQKAKKLKAGDRLRVRKEQ